MLTYVQTEHSWIHLKTSQSSGIQIYSNFPQKLHEIEKNLVAGGGGGKHCRDQPHRIRHWLRTLPTLSWLFSGGGSVCSLYGDLCTVGWDQGEGPLYGVPLYGCEDSSRCSIGYRPPPPTPPVGTGSLFMFSCLLCNVNFS